MKITLIDEHCGSAVTVRKAQRPKAWTRNIEYVSIEMSSEFRKAIHESLPEVKFSVDAFHIVQRTHQMLTAVRQYRAHDLHGHRGRNIDPAYKCRRLLTRNIENLSQKQTERLKEILESDIELVVIYAIKDHVRDLLKTDTSESFATGWEKLSALVKASGMDEAKSLLRTFTAWKKELETYCLTRLTNARSEAANLTAKNFHRMGRGYINHEN